MATKKKAPLKKEFQKKARKRRPKHLIAIDIGLDWDKLYETGRDKNNPKEATDTPDNRP